MQLTEIKFKKLRDDATIPQYAHDGDIGMDVVATSVYYDGYNDCYIYGTGLCCETQGHIGILGMPRSSVYKTDAYLTNSVGLIDSDQYRGEIKLIYRNRIPLYSRAMCEAMRQWSCKGWFTRTFGDFYKFYNNIRNYMIQDWQSYAPYKVGDRIGQLVRLKFNNCKIVEVDEVSSTERGEGGFGSSGK